jgi:hypothetical protein
MLGLDGSKLTIEAYVVNAVGSTVVDLHGFAPLSEIHAVSQMRATMQRGGQIEPVAVNGDLTILIGPLPEGVVPAQQPAAAPGADQAPAAPSATGT